MLAVIDYGGGNLGSLLSALERHGAQFVVVENAGALAHASGAILPGDGAFAATMDALRERRFDRAILGAVDRGMPFLGICVGMQLLFERSTEFGDANGLGIFPGTVAPFVDAPRIPHMGWNRLERTGNHPFVDGLGDEEYAYFLHSYRAPVGEATVAAATHGERFSAIVAQRNVMGTQFHPEKSQRSGAVLLENFLRIVTSRPVER